MCLMKLMFFMGKIIKSYKFQRKLQGAAES